MDNKYQDIRIHNWKTNEDIFIRRMVEIDAIVFYKEQFMIIYCDKKKVLRKLFDKNYNQLIID